MQICKSRKVSVFVSIVFIGLYLCMDVFAQNSNPTIEFPEMPEMPSMPTVGGGFYTPSFPVRPGNTKPAATENAKEKTESVLTEALTPESAFNPALIKGSTLTAYDISSLYDSGLFSNLSSLDNKGGLSNYTTSTSTNVLLQQVLNSLNDLKKQQQNASAKEKNELDAVKILRKESLQFYVLKSMDIIFRIL